MAKITYKLFYNTTRQVGGHKGWSVAVGIGDSRSKNISTHYFLDFHKPEHWNLLTAAPDEFRLDMVERLEEVNSYFSDEQKLEMADFKARYRGVKRGIARTAILDFTEGNPILQFMPWNDELNVVSYRLQPYSHFVDGNNFRRNTGNAAPAFMFIDDHDPMGLGFSMTNSQFGIQDKPASEINLDTALPEDFKRNATPSYHHLVGQ